MKKFFLMLALALVFTLTFSALATGAAEPKTQDQPSTWAAVSVDKARDLGFVTDEINKNFQASTTREEFCVLISTMLIRWYDAPIDYQIEVRGLTPVAFNDTDVYMIRAAAALGIVSGTGNGNFSPDVALTREQAATMLRNTLTAIGIDTANPASVYWSDKSDISGWAKEAADVMYAAKIMNGTSTNPLTFSPKTPYTHEQAIITVLNLWDYAIAKGASRALPESDIEYGKPQANQPTHTFDMTDPNVKMYPIYATAKSAKEFQTGMAAIGKLNWNSAAETVAIQKNEDPDYMIDGKTFYDWRMKPIQEWVDKYLTDNDLSIKGKTDYEKTAIIQQIILDGWHAEQKDGYSANGNGGRFEEFIGLWRPGFRFSSGDCVPCAEAIRFLMIAMDFRLFDVVSCIVSEAHATNAYWDDSAKAVRFVDANSFSSWNCFVDELDEWYFYLD